MRTRKLMERTAKRRRSVFVRCAYLRNVSCLGVCRIPWLLSYDGTLSQLVGTPLMIPFHLGQVLDWDVEDHTYAGLERLLRDTLRRS